MRTKAGMVAALVLGMAWLPRCAWGLESAGGAAALGAERPWVRLPMLPIAVSSPMGRVPSMSRAGPTR